MSVFRDMRHAGSASLSNRSTGNIRPAKSNLACGGFLKSGKAVDKLRLTVAVDSGNTYDFAFSHIERNILHGVIFVNLGRYRKPFNFQNNLTRFCLDLVDFKLYGSSYHHIGKFLLVCVLGINRTDTFSLAKNRYPVGYSHDFIQFM